MYRTEIATVSAVAESEATCSSATDAEERLKSDIVIESEGVNGVDEVKPEVEVKLVAEAEEEAETEAEAEAKLAPQDVDEGTKKIKCALLKKKDLSDYRIEFSMYNDAGEVVMTQSLSLADKIGGLSYLEHHSQDNIQGQMLGGGHDGPRKKRAVSTDTGAGMGSKSESKSVSTGRVVCEGIHGPLSSSRLGLGFGLSLWLSR